MILLDMSAQAHSKKLIDPLSAAFVSNPTRPNYEPMAPASVAVEESGLWSTIL